MPSGIKSKGERIKKLNESLKRLKEVEKELVENKKDKINLTDNDAVFQRDKGGRKIVGYRGEIVVDKEAQVLLLLVM